MKNKLFLFLKNFRRKCITYFIVLTKPKNVRIQGSYFFLDNTKFNIDSDSTVLIKLGKGVKLSNVHFYIRGNYHKIIIQNHARVSKGTFWMEDEHGLVQIGKNTTVESAEFACTEPKSSIVIGNNCMFSKDIEIRTGDSHSIIDMVSNKRINFANNIKIEDNVWLGARVVVLKGSKIESNVVVGIGSIVTNKNVLKSNSIYTGIPARPVKTDIYWTRKRIYIGL